MSKTYGKIGKRFTVVIPKEIRERMNLREGEEIKFVLQGGKIFIELRRGDPFERLSEIAGDFEFTRDVKKEAEKAAIKIVSKQ